MANCRNCYYHGWAGLQPWCYEPGIDKAIKNSTKKCPKWQDAHKKIMPDEKGVYNYGYPSKKDVS